MAYLFQAIPRENYEDKPTFTPSQESAIDMLINEFRKATDMSDENIYDEITNSGNFSEDEEQALAEKLGVI